MAHDADACNNLGRFYEEGLGVSQDAALAAALYEKACMAGLAQGCNNLGLLYASSPKASGELSAVMRWRG
jgi:TPR repeat protein